MLCLYLLTLWRHRMCTAICRGLGCQMLYMTITKPYPNTVLYTIIVFAIIIAKQQHMVLTDWTTSLASSALHLKGLSWQEIFLLNKKEKSQQSSLHLHSQLYMYIKHIHTAGVLPPTTYHSIPPLFVGFCTSALQCSWADLMISTAKSYKKDIRNQRKR